MLNRMIRPGQFVPLGTPGAETSRKMETKKGWGGDQKGGTVFWRTHDITRYRCNGTRGGNQAMSKTRTKETNAVLDNHLAAAQRGDLEAVLNDFSEDSVLFLPQGPDRGIAVLREFYTAFLAKPPSGFPKAFELLRRDVDGEVAYIVWKAVPGVLTVSLLVRFWARLDNFWLADPPPVECAEAECAGRFSIIRIIAHPPPVSTMAQLRNAAWAG